LYQAKIYEDGRGLFFNVYWLTKIRTNYFILTKIAHHEEAPHEVIDPIHFNLSAIVYYFSLTTKHHQPAYQPTKPPDKQGR
jgi:hypothetical protein